MYKVMIAEDELLVRAGIRSSVNWDKYNMNITNEASNGQIAWEHYLKDTPDIVITDIKMPVMNGLQLIKKIREINQETKIIILSCVEDFALAQEAIKLGVQDYILKLTMTPEEIAQVLEKIQKELDQSSSPSRPTVRYEAASSSESTEKLILNYLLYDICSPQDFKSRMIKSHPLHIPKALTAVIMKIDQYENLQNIYQDEQGQLINFTLLNIINEVFTRRHMDAEAQSADFNTAAAHGPASNAMVIYETQSRYLFLFSSADPELHFFYNKITPVIQEIRQLIRDYFNVSTTFAFSGQGSDFSDLKNLYAQCCTCLNYSFFIGTNQMIYYNDFDPDLIRQSVTEKAKALFSDPDCSFPLQEKQLKQLQQVMEGAFEAEKIHKAFYNAWISVLHNAGISSGEISDRIISFTNACSSCKSYDEVLDLFHKSILGLNEDLKQRKLYSREVIQTIQFIQENYNKQVTLREISDHVNFSPNYLSNLFKKELKISLFEYLNRYRVEKSMELLLTTNMKTYEVAYAVGFSDESYFSKTFKKYTGKRPNECKKHPSILS